jgi:inosine triphosphate pyrophosphatase
MRILFVTGNKGKLKEAKTIIPEIEGCDIDLPEIQEVDSKKIIEHKLIEAAKYSQENLMVEDGSVYMDCINGLPGPLIKWFSKTIGNEGIAKIAKGLGNNKAVATVWIGFRDKKGKIKFFEGSIKGEIVEPRGENGFGWDPVFQPEGYDKTFGEMSEEEKNKVSMRRIALEKLKKYLKKIKLL